MGVCWWSYGCGGTPCRVEVSSGGCVVVVRVVCVVLVDGPVVRPSFLLVRGSVVVWWRCPHGVRKTGHLPLGVEPGPSAPRRRSVFWKSCRRFVWFPGASVVGAGTSL